MLGEIPIRISIALLIGIIEVVFNAKEKLNALISGEYFVNLRIIASGLLRQSRIYAMRNLNYKYIATYE